LIYDLLNTSRREIPAAFLLVGFLSKTSWSVLQFKIPKDQRERAKISAFNFLHRNQNFPVVFKIELL
jgi:hypothetical protein